jgi:hypothetical protein
MLLRSGVACSTAGVIASKVMVRSRQSVRTANELDTKGLYVQNNIATYPNMRRDITRFKS